MDATSFGRVRELLAQSGIVVDEARYDDEAFGSWFVYVRTDPRLGVVWDGKDRWLLVRRETERESSWGLRIWDDIWTAQQASDQTPESAVAVVEELVGDSARPPV